jgi:hypothetical protein
MQGKSAPLEVNRHEGSIGVKLELVQIVDLKASVEETSKHTLQDM